MAEAYLSQLQQPKLHQLGFDDRFSLIVDHEASERSSKSLKRLIKSANFPEQATLEDLDDRPARGIDKAKIAALANCEWISQLLNVIIIGATGVGKTWFACAFGAQACRQRIPTLFYRASDLYSEIAVAIIDGSLPKLKAKLIKPKVLVIDDFGLGVVTPQAAQVLLDVIDKRMRTGSLLITSQFPTEEWFSHFPDPTMADAILDRVIHQSHRINLKGDSMRKLNAKRRMKRD